MEQGAGGVRSVADALRYDWAATLAWAVPGGPWGMEGLAARAAELAAGSARAPWTVVAVVEDAPLGGRLANLYVALSAVAWAKEASRHLGRPVVPTVCLLSSRRRSMGPLYAVGASGELRRVSATADGPRAGLALTGAMAEVCRRDWPLARHALADAAAAGGDVHAGWALRVWRGLLDPLGCIVWHAALPPLAAALTTARSALQARSAAVAGDVGVAARRLALGGLGVAAPGQAGEATLASGLAGRGGQLLLLLTCLRPLGMVADDDDLGALAQLSGAAARITGGRPVLRPRPRYTLVPPAAAAFARAHGAPLAEGAKALRTARDHALLGRGSPRVQRGAQALGRSLDAALGELGQAVALELPRASGLLIARGERLRYGVRLLVAELAARERGRQRALAAAWRYLGNTLYPLDHDQEAWLAAYPWLAAGASGLLARLLREPAGPERQLVCWPEPGAGALGVAPRRLA